MGDPVFLSDFRPIRPRYTFEQGRTASNLTELRLLLNERRVAAGLATPLDRRDVEARIRRFGMAASRVRTRGTEIADFILDLPRQRGELSLFGAPALPGIDRRGALFHARAVEVFRAIYDGEEAGHAERPGHLVHVTCTGYRSPSAAQIVAAEWTSPRRTRVTHAYHMGCYASLPAIRIAAGLSRLDGETADVVHTEICTLHFDPLALEPEQLVIQSLFADGHVKYAISARPPELGFEVIALDEQLVPGSADHMTWAPGPTHFAMTLSREVPRAIAAHLPPFVEGLLAKARVAPGALLIFAIHPGGPRIIESVEASLHLDPPATVESHEVLARCGNMSSATLPHIWDRILKNPERPSGATVVSLAFGPGLTLSGGVFRLCRR